MLITAARINLINLQGLLFVFLLFQFHLSLSSPRIDYSYSAESIRRRQTLRQEYCAGRFCPDTEVKDISDLPGQGVRGTAHREHTSLGGGLWAWLLVAFSPSLTAVLTGSGLPAQMAPDGDNSNSRD